MRKPFGLEVVLPKVLSWMIHYSLLRQIINRNRHWNFNCLLPLKILLFGSQDILASVSGPATTTHSCATQRHRAFLTKRKDGSLFTGIDHLSQVNSSLNTWFSCRNSHCTILEWKAVARKEVPVKQGQNSKLIVCMIQSIRSWSLDNECHYLHKQVFTHITPPWMFVETFAQYEAAVSAVSLLFYWCLDLMLPKLLTCSVSQN